MDTGNAEPTRKMLSSADHADYIHWCNAAATSADARSRATAQDRAAAILAKY